MQIGYIEIVTPDVDGTVEMFRNWNRTVFEGPVPELGNAMVASLSGGGRVGVRAPMHDAEEATTRTYFLTENIEEATAAAIATGAELAHPVMEIPGQGKFSIFFQGGNQFGLWQN